MRTTLTVDDDLMRNIKDLAHREGCSVKQIINRLLRLGLRGLEDERPKKRYRCPTFAMGSPSRDLDKALAVASALEDDEVAVKLELRK